MIFNRDYRQIMREGKRILKYNNDDMAHEIHYIDAIGKDIPCFKWDMLLVFSLISIAVLYILLFATPVFSAELPEHKAVMAIIGEAENQGYEGMLAIACSLRHRGSLRGVYGLHSYRVKHHLYSKKTLHEAETAWIESSQVDTVNGATGWGNEADLNKFCSQKWWSKCIVTARVGDHWFYREVKQ